MAQKCPTCGLVNPARATRCDCGFDFETREQDASFLTKAESANLGNFWIGFALGFFGSCLGLLVFAFPTGTETRRGAAIGFSISLVLGFLRLVIMMLASQGAADPYGY